MKKELLVTTLSIGFLFAHAQEKKVGTSKLNGLDAEAFLKSSAEAACKCVDSIDRRGKSRIDISKEISRCIDQQTVTYQMTAKLFSSMDLNKEIEKALNGDTLKKKGDKRTNTQIIISTDF